MLNEIFERQNLNKWVSMIFSFSKLPVGTWMPMLEDTFFIFLYIICPVELYFFYKYTYLSVKKTEWHGFCLKALGRLFDFPYVRRKIIMHPWTPKDIGPGRCEHFESFSPFMVFFWRSAVRVSYEVDRHLQGSLIPY